MGLPVTVFSSEDAGAPQLENGKPSSVINILKKCLVEGYGSNTGLGWTVAFEDVAAFKIAFRNSTSDGSGGYFQLESNGGTNNNQNSMWLTGAKSMSALDTFHDRSYRQWVLFTTSINRWTIVGTNTGFYFFGGRDGIQGAMVTSECPAMFIGDFISYIPNDVGRFTTMIRAGIGSDAVSGNWSHYLGNFSGGSSLSTTQINKIYNTDGSSNFGHYKITADYIQGATSLIGTPTATRMFTEINIINSLNASSTTPDGDRAGESQVQPFIRGKLPGALNTPQGGHNGDPTPVMHTINGHEHVLLDCYYGGRFWVNTEVWE